MDPLLPTFERSLPVLCVHRWLDSKKRRSYLFVGQHTKEARDQMQEAEKDHEYWSPELGQLTGMPERPSREVRFVFGTVWPDDDVTYALTKIRMHIEKSEPGTELAQVIPFAWSAQGIRRFHWPTVEVDPETFNPWAQPLPILDRQPEYHPYEQIGSEELHLALYDDLSATLKKKELHMYFPDREQTERLISSAWIQSTEKYLMNVWSAPAPPLRDISSQLDEVTWEANIDTEVSLAELYEQTHATKRTPLIQWCDDVTRVLYKLYKKHNVSVQHLNKWTNRYYIPKVPCLQLYDVWNRSSTYTQTRIEESGRITITYHIDSADTTFRTLDDVRAHATEVVANIQEMLKVPKISLHLADISYFVAFAFSMVNLTKDAFRTINDEPLHAIPLFHAEAEKSEKRTLVFKRASTLEHRFSLSEVVQSFSDQNLSRDQIDRQLSDFGYETDQIKFAIQEVADAQLEGKAVRTGLHPDVDPVLVLTFYHQDGKFILGVRHAPNVEEAKRAIQWLASVIFYARQKAVKKPAAQLPEIVPVPPVLPPPVAEPEPSASEEEEEEQPSISRTRSEEDFSFFDGGARGVAKKGDGFLLGRLKKADNEYYTNKEVSYARLCQQDRQPLVMTEQEWERSKTKLANSIKYRGNYYSCPRIWCKEAGIVMTREELKANRGKCPGTGESPEIMGKNDLPLLLKVLEKEEKDLLPEDRETLKKKDKDRYVGFNNKNIIKMNNRDVYPPCCFDKDQFSEGAPNIEDLVIYNRKGEPLLPAPSAPPGPAPGLAPEQPAAAAPVQPAPTTPIAPATKTKTYILTKDGPATKDRVGDIPMALYHLFFPEYAEQSDSISTKPTIVRHGIGAHEDTLMNSIAYTLGKSSKQELIKELFEGLDPLSFISLEGGAVLAAFTNDEPPQISYTSWKTWVDNYPDYKSIRQLDLDHARDDPKILREMKIYEAYLRFLHHLESDDEKSTSVLYHLLTRFGVFLMVWEREETGDMIRLSCPYFLGYERMREMITQFKDRYIMLLYHSSYRKPYYEPLEIRTLHVEPVREISLNDYPMISDLTAKCPVAYGQAELSTIETLRGLIQWTYQFIPINFRNYMPHSIVLSADLCIEAVLTHGNHWIQLPRPSLQLLPHLVRILQGVRISPKIQYHEDMDTGAIASHTAPIYMSEYKRWKGKCQSLGFHVLEQAPPPPPVAPVVSVLSPAHQEELEQGQKEQREWRDLQLRIAKYLLYQYEGKVVPHTNLPRKQFVEKIMKIILTDLWKEETANKTLTWNMRKRIKTTVEEMPLVYGRESLQRWIHTIVLSPYRFYHNEVMTSEDDKHNWTFSQLAVEMGVPKGVFVPTAAAIPEPNTTPESYDVQQVSVSQAPGVPPPADLPLMARAEYIRVEDMPSKWKKIRIQLMRVKTYKKDHIPDLVRWVARKIHSPFSWDDIVQIRYIQIAGNFILPKQDFMDSIGALIQESTFKQELAKSLNMNKTAKDEDLLQNMWENKGTLSDKLDQIAKIQPTPILPMDIDLRIMAQLFDMFVLVMFRKPYRKESEGAKESEEGEINGLRVSSVLYSNQQTTMDRPLIMLYRDREGEKGEKSNTYNLIMTITNKEFYFSSASDASLEIQAILYAHRDKQKK